MLHVKTYGRRHQGLYFLSLMILFWGIFDGITTYITPLVLTEHGMSKTVMGLIIGSSSVFGAIFDFLMCKIFKNSYFRRSFLLMFGLCIIYLIVLATASTLSLFLLAMVLWGIYYDLKNFGSFDFITRFTRPNEHSSSFGVLAVFQASGYLVAPIIAGLLIFDQVGQGPFYAAGVFLTMSFLIFLFLIFQESKYPREKIAAQYRYRGLIHEIKLWRRLDKVLLPVLILTMMLNVIDSFFWTIGPLVAESFKSIHQLAGLFIAAYELPVLLVGWFVGRINRRLGKKRTAFISLLIGSLGLMSLNFVTEPILMVAIVFGVAMMMSLAWPSLRAAFADYISEAGKYEQEIEGLEDLFTNFGYVIGPILAGFLADKLGNTASFSVLGVIGAITALYLMKITPRKINVLKQI